MVLKADQDQLIERSGPRMLYEAGAQVPTPTPSQQELERHLRSKLDEMRWRRVRRFLRKVGRT